MQGRGAGAAWGRVAGGRRGRAPVSALAGGCANAEVAVPAAADACLLFGVPCVVPAQQVVAEPGVVQADGRPLSNGTSPRRCQQSSSPSAEVSSWPTRRVMASSPALSAPTRCSNRRQAAPGLVPAACIGSRRACWCRPNRVSTACSAARPRPKKPASWAAGLTRARWKGHIAGTVPASRPRPERSAASSAPVSARCGSKVTQYGEPSPSGMAVAGPPLGLLVWVPARSVYCRPQARMVLPCPVPSQDRRSCRSRV